MTDIDRIAHRNWIGMAQPVGLVVSPQALLDAQLILPARDPVTQAAYEGWLEACEQKLDGSKDDPASVESKAALRDAFQKLGETVFGWQAGDFAGVPDGPQVPDRLAVHLPERNITLRPDLAIVDGERVVLLVTLGIADNLERLLRENGVATGIAFTGKVLQLVYAPRGESQGTLTFPLDDMATTLGRELLMAMRLLFGAERLFAARDDLVAVLQASRRYQNQVSTELAEQVLGALIELLRGFGAADQAASGRLLGDLPRRDPDQLYGGLLTVIMRLVFLLYAEDRGLLPGDELYSGNYAVSGLFERLRDDVGRHPDTMDQRFGAWAALLSTFRLVFYGGKHASLHLPPRHGELFDPERFSFLEGRASAGAIQRDETQDAPLIPDGTVWRMLEKLLMLKGERLSYGALDVEQIGSVYEAMMGFRVEVALKPTLIVRPDHVAIDLADLLARKGDARAKFLKESASCELAAKDGAALKLAASVEQLAVALARRASGRYPNVLAAGSLYLIPGEERRRSGSHYTPRELTSPIVAKALEPIWSRLGANPKPQEILALKVCDPAMGSGAFLVEACRQLATKLVLAWEAHGGAPAVAREEDLETFARRVVARRCLYGVDKNRFAVGLAKLSLWLVTLSKEQAFTFLDHALRHGDSLVGLRRAQIARVTWKSTAEFKQPARISKTKSAPRKTSPLFPEIETESRQQASLARAEIAAGDDSNEMRIRTLFEDAERSTAADRILGDLIVASFFSAEKDKQRETKRAEYQKLWEEIRQAPKEDRRHVVELRGLTAELREGKRPAAPFHWEVEFPEVFPRGFDVVVGNPPFMGKNGIAAACPIGYLDWLKEAHPESHGNSDIVAHFFRRAFSLLADGGAFGLIATNTISQGDTRATGLRWIATNGGTIFCARRRVRWPGQASVVVSVVHVFKGELPGRMLLDGREVDRITAFLFYDGGHDDPKTLEANVDIAYQGSVILGMGFTFDDTDKDGVASPVALKDELIANDRGNADRIFPYIGGEELNDSPAHVHHRFVINFGNLSENEARKKWPDLMRIVEDRVKPERLLQKREVRAEKWWQFGERATGLYEHLAPLDQAIAVSRHGEHFSFSVLDARQVFAESLVLICRSTHAAFCSLQSRSHEIWTRFFGSSMKDDLRYTPSDCFETFPFPPQWDTSPALEAIGKEYFEHRVALMVRLNMGMTALYNRFHDPDDLNTDVKRLRDLHAAMDRAVLDAYGWTDLNPVAEFQIPNADPDAPEPARDPYVKRKRKSPYRLRWRQEDHDTILARLFALNRECAAEQGGKS